MLKEVDMELLFFKNPVQILINPVDQVKGQI
jgi:hypothetical protein